VDKLKPRLDRNYVRKLLKIIFFVPFIDLLQKKRSFKLTFVKKFDCNGKSKNMYVLNIQYCNENKNGLQKAKNSSFYISILKIALLGQNFIALVQWT